MVQKGPKSGQDAAEYRQNGPNIHLLEDLDIDQDIKKGAQSPKSAHHAMGLEAGDFYGCESDGGGAGNSSDQQRQEEAEEEERKGLWRSIVGYFRGPRKGTIDTKSVKDSSNAAEATSPQLRP